MVKLLIQNYQDREKIVIGLINNGFKVSIVERPDPNKYLGKLYYVCVEAPEKENKNIDKMIIKNRNNMMDIYEVQLENKHWSKTMYVYAKSPEQAKDLVKEIHDNFDGQIEVNLYEMLDRPKIIRPL